MSQQKPTRRKIFDISVPISSDTPIYPGDPGVTSSPQQSLEKGGLANVYSVCLGTHTGTHIDAPHHVNSNWPTLQEQDLGIMVGPATVFHLDVERAITAEDVAKLSWDGVERALFRTRNSLLWDQRFHEDFVYMADDAARFLAQSTRVRLVGFDYLSVEGYEAERLTVHHEFLGRGIIILEGLDLSQVTAGEYELVCLPLKLATPDGAPARAILIEC